MTFAKGTENISELLLLHEVEEYKDTAKLLGLSGKQANEFVRNSVIHYVQVQCDSILMEKEEMEKAVQKALGFLGIS